jgi:hypothetical protein
VQLFIDVLQTWCHVMLRKQAVRLAHRIWVCPKINTLTFSYGVRCSAAKTSLSDRKTCAFTLIFDELLQRFQ